MSNSVLSPIRSTVLSCLAVLSSFLSSLYCAVLCCPPPLVSYAVLSPIMSSLHHGVSPLVVAVEGQLGVLLLPGAPEGPGDVPAGPELAEEHLVQPGALVVLGAVLRLLRHLLEPEQFATN